MLSPANEMPECSKNAVTTRINRSAHRCCGPCTVFIFILFCFATSTTAQELDTPILLEPGLNIVGAIRQANVDYEGLRSIDSVSDETVVVRLNWAKSDQTSAADVETINGLPSLTRVMRREDMASSNRIVASFHWGDPALLPGTTSILASTAVLSSLKSGAGTAIVFGMHLGPPNDVFASRKYYRGTIRMLAREHFPVLLDGARTMVPVVHATGTLSVGQQSGEAEFWWLDQPDNPLTLRWKFLGDTVQVVRIDRPETGKAAAIFKPEACRAELHGIYFETASAILLPASDAALARVTSMLTEHADWRITIEGHTDNIGVDASNQKLSEQRASAVRTALIEQFNVTQDRLTTMGFGETRPIETNETLEGRARNRRVELTHDCPP